MLSCVLLRSAPFSDLQNLPSNVGLILFFFLFIYGIFLKKIDELLPNVLNCREWLCITTLQCTCMEESNKSKTRGGNCPGSQGDKCIETSLTGSFIGNTHASKFRAKQNYAEKKLHLETPSVGRDYSFLQYFLKGFPWSNK